MAKHRHLIDTTKLDRDWVEGEVFSLCDKIRIQSDFEPAMKGRSLYCLFYEPSFLTRTSFEQAAGLMDGQAFHTEDASQFFPVHAPNYIDNIINILASLHINLVVLRSGDSGVVERAASAEAMPVVNGGSPDDHPTQALADLYTIHHELGGVDGKTIAVVGRLEHRNVSALLKGLAMFNDIKLMLVPFSGQVPEEVISHCVENGVTVQEHRDIDSLSEADAIYLEEIRNAGLYDAIWQAFAVLLPVKTVGVMGDGRTYDSVCGLRAVTSTDGMTADIYPFDASFLSRVATRIINEVQGINRVVYDYTSKPPGTIEWE